jgi:hypothetical protein
MAGVPEDELNPFHVLGVEATASDIELKKAYRQLAVMVSNLCLSPVTLCSHILFSIPVLGRVE